VVVSHPSIPPAFAIRPVLAALVGRDVVVHTPCTRHRGTLVAVAPHAVWLELRDDCLLAVTEAILAVTPAPVQPDDVAGEEPNPSS
jgi:hypothetical protein